MRNNDVVLVNSIIIMIYHSGVGLMIFDDMLLNHYLKSIFVMIIIINVCPI